MAVGRLVLRLGFLFLSFARLNCCVAFRLCHLPVLFSKSANDKARFKTRWLFDKRMLVSFERRQRRGRH